jgi:5'-3' exonuclease
MKEYTHLLIDGRNVLYRALFAETNHIRPGEEVREGKPGQIFRVYLKFLREYLNRFKPKEVHVFWDDKSANLWRRAKYAEYKNNRKHVTPGLAALLSRYYNMSLMVLDNLGVKQYLREQQEADDLIYAFCRSTSDQCCLISSDGDLKQIPQKMPHIDIYGPMSKDANEPVKMPEFDVVLQKSLMGDDSDNIPGYAGIGEKRAAAMAKDQKARDDFLASEKAVVLDGDKKVVVGKSLFESNLELIDLARSPHVESNVEYVTWAKERDVVYNHAELIRLLRKYNLSAVLEDVHTTCVPFTQLALGKTNGK